MKIAFFTTVLFLSCIVCAQVNSSLRFVNEKNEPVVGATFHYRDQFGVSDTNGLISFQIHDTASLQIRHVSFGSLIIPFSDLKTAVNKGLFVIKDSLQMLQPVIVLSVRNKTNEHDLMDFTFREKMAYDGGELLTRSAAISGIRKSGSYGLDPVFRGFKYDQINIVMNGAQCATAACPNRMDPPTSQMAPNMIDQVQVLKGPYALRFGGGLGATINFVSFTPTFHNNGLKGRLSSRFDLNGMVTRNEGMIGWNGSGFDLELLASVAGGSDYIDGGANTIQSDFNRNSVGLSTAIKINDKQVVEANAFYNWARDVDFPTLMMDLRSDQTTMVNVTHSIQLTGKPLKNWTTTGFVSHVDHTMDNLLKPLDPRMVNATTDALTLNTGARTEGLWEWDHVKLYAGGDIKQEHAEGIRTREMLMGSMAGMVFQDNPWQHAVLTRWSLFSEYNFMKNGLSMVLSARTEVNEAHLLDSDVFFTEQYGDIGSILQINPGFSAGAIKNVNNGFAIGLWLARAQRSAGITERFINRFSVGVDPYELLGNPNLLPEVNNQADLTFKWNTVQTTVELTMFTAYLTDYISSQIDTNLMPLLMSQPGVRRFVNIDRAIKSGFEIGYFHEINSWICHRIDIAYTYGQDLNLAQPLPEIAPFDLNYQVTAHALSHKLYAQAGVRYVAAQNRNSVEFGESVSPSFFTIDLETGYRIKQNMEFVIGANNLLDEEYAEHLSRAVLGSDFGLLNAPGRSIYTSLSISF